MNVSLTSGFPYPAAVTFRDTISPMLNGYRVSSLALLLSLSSAGLHAQQETDQLKAVHQIKTEAFQNSKVMDHLANLSDLYGPRLTASPGWEQAAQWAMTELKSYGLANVHEETWGPFGRSWSVESYNLDMLAPRYSHLVATPLAWSSPTQGAVKGELLYAPFDPGSGDTKKLREALDQFKVQWRGKLKGKIVMITNAKRPKPATKPIFNRYTDAELAERGKAPTPTIRNNVTIDQLNFPKDEDETEKFWDTLPNTLVVQLYAVWDQLQADMGAFLKEEGVAAVLSADRRSHNGTLNAEAAGSWTTKTPMAPASFVVTEEQYSRMQRLVEKNQPVTVGLDLKAEFSDHDVDGKNIIAEIPGAKKPDEIVMIGAHFDSWASGTGATDNGAGSAVMMEVVRILKTLNLKMDRTVRIGLWSGEEQGLFGSRAYVKQHFADVDSGEVKAEHAKFDIYLNLDNGSGKIRGVYLEGNDAIRPAFENYLAPFRDMDVITFSLKQTKGTDHQSFDDAGLPAFQFIQDPLDYGLTHHSNTDTYSHAVPEDLMQASAVIATLVYDFANREDAAPRKTTVRDGKLVGY